MSAIRPRLRVHVCPVGFEEDRIVIPISELKADRVYLITKSGEDLAKDAVQRIITALKSQKLEPTVVCCDIHDLEECFCTISEILYREALEGNDVYVNVSSGTNILCIAGTMACMMWGGVPYYVIPKTYAPRGEPLHLGVKKIFELPRYRIFPPRRELISILGFISSKNRAVSHSELIAFLKSQGLIKTENEKLTRPSQSEYQQLENNFLRELRDERGYVVETGETRAKRVHLAEEGKTALRMFGFLVRS
ncbi:MAG: DUF6293 family protein [Candidatus Bathyarchaeia archaeon]